MLLQEVEGLSSGDMPSKEHQKCLGHTPSSCCMQKEGSVLSMKNTKAGLYLDLLQMHLGV